ncbi:MAG: helix-turn-helix domain-containing protein [Micavibrio sp.]
MAEKPVIAIFAQNAAQNSYLCALVRLAGAEPLPVREAAPQAAILLAAEGGYSRAEGQPVIMLGDENNLSAGHRGGTGGAAGGRDGVAGGQAGGGAGEGAAGILYCASPVRAARLIACLEKLLRDNNSPPGTIAIGPATLSLQDGVWQEAGAAPVRLTEKEVDILLYLFKEAAPVSREDLLRHVWEYAHDVQTHTLETHIYRLRQKIEKDPASPSILVTVEEGYALAPLARRGV